MADQIPTQPNAADAAAQAAAPLTVVHQYLKDFSFENPNAANGFAPLKEMPTGYIRVDVRVKPMTPPDIEVSLFLAAEAKIGDTTIYVVESEYAGVFRLGKVPQEHMLPLIMIGIGLYRIDIAPVVLLAVLVLILRRTEGWRRYSPAPARTARPRASRRWNGCLRWPADRLLDR